MKYATHEKRYFTNAVSARSIRNELDLTEKDRPTTTEVTAKSVNRNNIPKKQKIKKHTQIWIQDIPSSTSPTWSSRSDAEKEVCFNWKTKD